MVPFVSMSMEKIAYDTFQAFRGHDIYTKGPKEGARGGFPSGGCSLPSFSLISVRAVDSTAQGEQELRDASETAVGVADKSET